MNDNKKEVVYNGIPLTTILFAIFLILKLCGVINWPWIWVFAPLWIPFALVLALCMIIGIISIILNLGDRRWK